MAVTKIRSVFLAVSVVGIVGIGGVTGCSSTTSQTTAAVPAGYVTAPDGTVVFVGDATPTLPAAERVNVFGEFGEQQIAVAGGFGGKAGFQQHTFIEEGYDTDVAVCPAGQWLVFTSTRHNEAGDLYLQRVDGLSVTQLTDDPAEEAYPTFSPDGQRIAFSSNRSGSWDIYVTDLAGKQTTQITSQRTHELHPSFSPDGTKLVYSTVGNRSGQWELWTADLVSSERKMIGYGMFPVWSPAGDKIAFQRGRDRGSRWFSLWTLDLVDGEGRMPTEVAVSGTAAIVAPTWSPDGSKLAFTTVLKKGNSTIHDVWTIKADGTERRRLTDGTGGNNQPFWAVDNRIYFTSDRGGPETIWSTPADGTNFSTVAVPQD
ncbi:MAG: DPP IV N-terminal domain-containing protein [Phycisphaerae bacterium]